jgi:hypothetical protein
MPLETPVEPGMMSESGWKCDENPIYVTKYRDFKKDFSLF